MKRLQPVIWSKGTFLSPQHLQIQDRFIENTLQFRVEALNFRPWGFQRLQIDQEALAAGNFAISVASGILPDGLAFDIPASDPAPPAKPLAQHFEGQASLDIYLAIPQYRDRSLNVSVTPGNADTRYLTEAVLMRDENTGASEKPVQVARKNLRLLVEGESRQGTTAMRIASVRRTESGTFQLDSRFVPALLDLAASDYLIAILRRLVEILSAKSSVLAGSRRQKNQSLADFTASDIANFWLLYSVNSYFPLLRHLFETRKGHPEGMFSIMTSLAGALTTFSLKIQPRDLPAYDHDDLSRCFSELDEKVRDLLESVVPSNFVSLPLKPVEKMQSVYATAIAEDKYLTDTKMYLAIAAETKEANLIKKAPGLIKVASATHIDDFVRQAVAGMGLRHVEVPPSAIPVKLNYQYFSLHQAGNAWDGVRRARSLAAYVPGDFPNPQLELIILLPGAG